MENQVGTLLITRSLTEHDFVVVFAKRSGWLLVGLAKKATTYLTQSGQLVEIRIEEIKNETESINR